MFKDVTFDKELSEVEAYSMAVSDDFGIAVSGECGVSIVGTGGIAKSGEDGILVFIDDSSWDRSVFVAYVGIDGVLPDQFYEYDGATLHLSNYEQ